MGKVGWPILWTNCVYNLSVELCWNIFCKLYGQLLFRKKKVLWKMVWKIYFEDLVGKFGWNEWVKNVVKKCLEKWLARLCWKVSLKNFTEKLCSKMLWSSSMDNFGEKLDDQFAKKN